MELTGVKLKYRSPAFPPKHIQVNWIYELGFDEGKAYIFDGNLIQHLDYELIKMLFYPLNHYNWFEADRFLQQGVL